VKIVKDDYFIQKLNGVILYIADDSKSRARNFRNALNKGLRQLDNFPYKFRKSIHFNDEKIRDYIFMGYTIPYLIDSENDIIIVLDIFKWTDK
jgi:plasmid stabilization system protein ParE